MAVNKKPSSTKLLLSFESMHSMFFFLPQNSSFSLRSHYIFTLMRSFIFEFLRVYFIIRIL